MNTRFVNGCVRRLVSCQLLHTSLIIICLLFHFSASVSFSKTLAKSLRPIIWRNPLACSIGHDLESWCNYWYVFMLLIFPFDTKGTFCQRFWQKECILQKYGEYFSMNPIWEILGATVKKGRQTHHKKRAASQPLSLITLAVRTCYLFPRLMRENLERSTTAFYCDHTIQIQCAENRPRSPTNRIRANRKESGYLSTMLYHVQRHWLQLAQSFS